MNELKAFVARKIDDGTCDPVPCIEVYLKSEADKVIAELKAENEMLRSDFERVEGRHTLNLVYAYGCQSVPEFHKTINDLIKRFNQNEKQLTHANYKRCLAMAMWCEEKCRDMENAVIKLGVYPYMSTCPTDCDTRYTFLKRWRKRWLGLAEKFKEAK